MKLQIFGFSIKINNCKILLGIVEVLGEFDKLVDIMVVIDKFDKIGIEGVVKELCEKQVFEIVIECIFLLFEFLGDNVWCFVVIKEFLQDLEIGWKGIEEFEFVFDQMVLFGLEKVVIEFDVILVCGFNYYIGVIFEVKVYDVKMGSICGGGWYDDLIGFFGLSGLLGVGIFFGVDCIYDVLLELGLFLEDVMVVVDVLFINFGDKEVVFCLKVVKEFCKNGISCEVYFFFVKMKK